MERVTTQEYTSLVEIPIATLRATVYIEDNKLGIVGISVESPEDATRQIYECLQRILDHFDIDIRVESGP